MDFARQQRDPARHLIGITFVVIVHAIVIYALVTGLARKAIEVIKKPLTATIIEAIKVPPPPPPPPPPTAPVISAVTATPPTVPNVIAPPAPVAVAKPAIRKGLVPVEITNPEYPRDAIRAGIQSGKVVCLLNVDEKGNVVDVKLKSSEPPRVFDREVIRTLMRWKFIPDGEKYVAEVEINFTLKDE